MPSLIYCKNYSTCVIGTFWSYKLHIASVDSIALPLTCVVQNGKQSSYPKGTAWCEICHSIAPSFAWREDEHQNYTCFWNFFLFLSNCYSNYTYSFSLLCLYLFQFLGATLFPLLIGICFSEMKLPSKEVAYVVAQIQEKAYCFYRQLKT